MAQNRLKGTCIYLAGPMERMSDNGENWRKIATTYLNKLGIGVFNPADKATDLAPEDAETKKYHNSLRESIRVYLSEGNKERASLYMQEFSSIIKEVVSADIRMVDLSSAILLHVDPDVHMCGSYSEQAWACLQRKPVIIFCEKGIHRIPGWLWGHCQWQMFFGSLDEALDYVRHIHEDETIDRLNRWKFFNFDKIFGNIKKKYHGN